MFSIIAVDILYGLWLLAPVITALGLTLMGVPRSGRIKGAFAAAVFALPAYLGLVCLFCGIAWPPDIFFHSHHARALVAVGNYEIEYRQEWGLDFYETYYEVTREDGRKAYLEIDGDDNKCWQVETRRVGERVYFLCDESTITEQTSYVDIAQRVLYSGALKCSRTLHELEFREYKDNPLVNREESGAAELYCR